MVNGKWKANEKARLASFFVSQRRDTQDIPAVELQFTYYDLCFRFVSVVFVDIIKKIDVNFMLS